MLCQVAQRLGTRSPCWRAVQPHQSFCGELIKPTGRRVLPIVLASEGTAIVVSPQGSPPVLVDADASSRQAQNGTHGTTATIGDETNPSARRRRLLMEDTRDFLRKDLQRLFDTGELTRHRYSPNIKFEDPVSKYDNLDGYMLNIRLLRTLFKIKFVLHTIEVTGSDTITARWSMALEFWPAPWKPELVFTGTTTYTVNPDTGIILSHVDTWDAIKNNQYPSLEGLQVAARQLLQVQLTPGDLEQPHYVTLKKLKDYEIRQYKPFLVATTNMGPGAGPASGTGFMDLAGYIFGGNQQQVKMEMTTPVLTEVTPGKASTSMSFVMEDRFSDVAQLPSPLDKRVTTRSEPGGFYAACRFSGWPLDFEVVQAERALRDALVRDGLTPQPGGAYQLLRYNEPTVPPFLRRNEVIIPLEGFKWP